MSSRLSLAPSALVPTSAARNQRQRQVDAQEAPPASRGARSFGNTARRGPRQRRPQSQSFLQVANDAYQRQAPGRRAASTVGASSHGLQSQHISVSTRMRAASENPPRARRLHCASSMAREDHQVHVSQLDVVAHGVVGGSLVEAGGVTLRSRLPETRGRG